MYIIKPISKFTNVGMLPLSLLSSGVCRAILDCYHSPVPIVATDIFAYCNAALHSVIRRELVLSTITIQCHHLQMISQPHVIQCTDRSNCFLRTESCDLYITIFTFFINFIANILRSFSSKL